MSGKVLNTSLFYDAFTGDAGGGSPYLNGNYTDRMKRVINIEYSWDLKKADLLFDAATKTITMQNQYDRRTFKGQEFSAKDLIAVVDSELNDGDFTITDISEDGKVITVSETIVDESSKADSVSVYGKTPITSIKLFYNLISNNTPEDYISLVDPFSKQNFFANNLDCEDDSTVDMQIGTKSFAWVTNKITDSVTDSTDEVTIHGTGLTNYVQSFQIIQYFKVVPIFLNSQEINFTETPIVPPDYYFAGNSLKYICRIEAKYISGNPVSDHTAIDNGINGTGTWANQAALGTKGEYSVTSITYSDNDTSESLTALDLNRNCLVTIIVNSRSGKFVTSGSDENSTQFILEFNTSPSQESEYQDTDTTMLDNLFADSCTNFLDSISENGEQFATTRQSITACKCDYMSATSSRITFIFSAGSLLKSYWKAKEDSDRKYEIRIITQDINIDTTIGHDRMTLLADFNSALWNRIDKTLFSLTGTGLQGYKYPDLGLLPRGSLNGFQGEAFFIDIGFKIKQHNSIANTDICTVNNITWQVVGSKTGQVDFVFERKIIDFSNAKKVLFVQDLHFSDNRGFVSYSGDPCNIVAVTRDEFNDTSTYTAWLAYYGLILRYEVWVSALEQYYSSDTSISDISKFIDEITQDWSSYNNAQGWNLKLIFSIQITNTDIGSINNYTTSIPIVVKKDNTIQWSGSSGALTETIQYFSEDGLIEIFSIDRTGITLIRTTLTGNFPFSDDEQYYGIMTATIDEGTIFERRLASSELDSETDSPFSPTDADESADFTWANGGCRINIFSGVKIIIESYFDSSNYNHMIKNINIQSVIGVTPIINSGS